MPDILTNAVLTIVALLAVLVGNLPSDQFWVSQILYILALFYSPLMVIALVLVHNNQPILGLIVGIWAIGVEREKKVKKTDENLKNPQNRNLSFEEHKDLYKNY